MIIAKSLNIGFVVPSTESIKEIEKELSKYDINFKLTYTEKYNIVDEKIIFRVETTQVRERDSEHYLLKVCDKVFEKFEIYNPFFLLDN